MSFLPRLLAPNAIAGLTVSNSSIICREQLGTCPVQNAPSCSPMCACDLMGSGIHILVDTVHNGGAQWRLTGAPHHARIELFDIGRRAAPVPNPQQESSIALVCLRSVVFRDAWEIFVSRNNSFV